jgi:hypothetical protein
VTLRQEIKSVFDRRSAGSALPALPAPGVGAPVRAPRRGGRDLSRTRGGTPGRRGLARPRSGRRGHRRRVEPCRASMVGGGSSPLATLIVVIAQRCSSTSRPHSRFSRVRQSTGEVK